MEIERKWIVKGWPDKGLPLICQHEMRQGYISVLPTVRIREEKKNGEDPAYILCFKSPGGLVRKEIEMEIPEDKFADLENLIGKPLVPKCRRTYLLPDGLHLEVNHVDEGASTEFWYAEVEFKARDQALLWDPASAGLETYLSDEVTGAAGKSMGAYWMQTRLSE